VRVRARMSTCFIVCVYVWCQFVCFWVVVLRACTLVFRVSLVYVCACGSVRFCASVCGLVGLCVCVPSVFDMLLV
jgi:hypothetical protein